MGRVEQSDSMPDDALPLYGGQGFVALVDHMGDDTTVVNSARVSFGKKVAEFDAEKDGGLVRYLAKNQHHSPFRHGMLQFHIKVPEMVCRQLYKHVVGIAWTPQTQRDVDHAWNEISGRYVQYDDFYVPVQFRPQSTDNKQGSDDGDMSNDLTSVCRYPDDDDSRYSVRELYEETVSLVTGVYKELIAAGVAKEQARLICPFATFTEVYWTASLQAVAHFIKLRQDSHAQGEIRELADAVRQLSEPIFPHSLDTLLNI